MTDENELTEEYDELKEVIQEISAVLEKMAVENKRLREMVEKLIDEISKDIEAQDLLLARGWGNRETEED
jgi:predicted nuclease with TOPRIM domain